MFVYEKDNTICVTFKSNKPVDAPEYVIVVDEQNKSITINGQTIDEGNSEVTVPSVEPEVQPEPEEIIVTTDPVEEEDPTEV